MKRHHHLLFAALAAFFCFGRLPAQDPRLADSLRIALRNHQQRDTAYFETLRELAISVLFVSPDSEALDYSHELVYLADSLGDSARLGVGHNLIANCYKNSGLSQRAMEEYLIAMKCFQAVDDQKWIANMHSNIGLIYVTRGDLDQALKEQELALEIRKRIKYTRGISGVYNSLGLVWHQKGDPQKALSFYQLALDSASNEPNPVFVGLYLGNIGNIYGTLKQFQKCRLYNQKALEIHRKYGLAAEISRDIHNIGESYDGEGKVDSAIIYLNRAYEMGDSLHYYAVTESAARNLKNIYAKRQDYQRAFYWSEVMSSQKDSLNVESVRGESRAMEISYRVAQREQEAAHAAETHNIQQEARIKRQQLLSWSMGIGIILLGGFGFVVHRRYREKKEANLALEQKVAERTTDLQTSNQLLKEEVAERERARTTLNTFIHRSSHDLKGPLTSILGLVEVAGNEGKASPIVTHIGAKARQLDGVLQQLIDKVEVDARVVEAQVVDWKQLWQELQDELATRPGFGEMQFVLDCGAIAGCRTDRYLMKTALRELLKNAIDFRANGGGVVTLRGHMTSQEHWSIAVSDNGKGIPEAQQARVWDMFFRGDNGSTGAGFGLYLVAEAAKRMGAETKLHSQPAPQAGDAVTTVTITFGQG